MYQGHYDLALLNFDLAFETVEHPKARDLYLASKCYSQINDEVQMFYYLESSVRAGLDKLFIQADSLWFGNYIFTNTYKDILKIRSDITDNNQNKDAETAFKSLEHHFKVMKVLKFYQAYETRDSLVEKYNSALKKFIPYSDSMTAEIINYYYKYPLPIEQKKLRTLIVMTKMFLTADLPEIDSLRSILFQHLDNGNITPYNFSVIFERLSLNNLEPDVYTSRQYGIMENSIPYKDYEQILENRKSVGLSIYYIIAPNYINNYVPQPISEIIKDEAFKKN